MKKHILMRLRITCLVVLSAITMAHGQKSNKLEDRWKPYISLTDYLTPFWKADTIHEEITQVIKDGESAKGTLLFNARQVLTVRSADLKKEFVMGKDWTYKDGKIVLPPGSAIPFIKKEDLVFNTKKPGWSMTGKTPGSFVLFSESTYFRSMQISVTYIAAKRSAWKGPVPVFDRKKLPSTLARLEKKDSLKVVFYGNSIETGANSSQYQNESPYMPSWPELIVYNLQDAYGTHVNFNNQSIGGKLAQWGVDSVSVTVLPQHPDLVIIGFGMNDGSAGVSPDKYRENIQGIITSVASQNPKAEFVLIAPMLANPYAVQYGIQASYKKELDKLARTGIVVADLTGVHEELLKHKNYQDMTGNNVNHPNDYLARWYAQFISGYLIRSK